MECTSFSISVVFDGGTRMASNDLNKFHFSKNTFLCDRRQTDETPLFFPYNDHKQ